MKRPLGITIAGGIATAILYGINYRSTTGQPPTEASLRPGRTLTCKLINVEERSRDTKKLRFELPTPEHRLGLPVGSHLLAIDPANIYRPYTPITLDQYDKGYFELLVKKYKGGYFSEILHKLQVGDSMDFSGPVHNYKYVPNTVGTICMIAGGTGITPMYQIIRTVLCNKDDNTELRLLYANRSAEDILLKDELNALQTEHPDRFKVHYIVEDPDVSIVQARKHNYRIGLIEPEMIQEHFPRPDEKDFVLLICGPTGMLRYLCGPGHEDGIKNRDLKFRGILKTLGFSRDQVFIF